MPFFSTFDLYIPSRATIPGETGAFLLNGKRRLHLFLDEAFNFISNFRGHLCAMDLLRMFSSLAEYLILTGSPNFKIAIEAHIPAL